MLIESFRFATSRSSASAPTCCSSAIPQLVVVRVSGFGQTGPYAKRPGFGTLVEAMSGFASRNGFEDREPVLPPLAMADMIAGLSGAMATVIAVRNVEVNGGRGQVIDLSLLESIFSILGPEAAIYKLSRQGAPARGQRLGGHLAAQRLRRPRTAAGWRSRPRPRP